MCLGGDEMYEPNGGNFYKPHFLMVSSGTFWRCSHGLTGYGDSLNIKGCWRCALQNPIAWLEWHFTKNT